jgi:RimJ/RimL family protein N-acetyltransferase
VVVAMPDALNVAVPETIETPRLVLRTFRRRDAPALQAALAESMAELRQHLGSLPWVAEEPTLATAERRCRQAKATFLLRTDLPYLAFDKASGRLVASAGLHRTDWALPMTEVGYWVRSSELRKGYASECVEALVGWAFEGLRAVRVELITDAQNLGSRAVALRCGFALEGVHRHVRRDAGGDLRDRCVYARLAPSVPAGPRTGAG